MNRVHDASRVDFSLRVYQEGGYLRSRHMKSCILGAGHESLGRWLAIHRLRRRTLLHKEADDSLR
jgi:hypothetical protein